MKQGRKPGRTRRRSPAHKNAPTEKRTTFDRRLAEASDFDLADFVAGRIDKHYKGVSDVRRMTPEERVITLVWAASGIIGNGGIEYLLEGTFAGDPHYRLTADAFKNVGLTRSYTAFQRLLRIFPDGKVPRSVSKRLSQLVRLRPKTRGELSRMVWQDEWDGTRDKQVAAFIRANAERLKHLT